MKRALKQDARLKEGIQWTLVSNGMIFVSQYLNSVIIGRIGADALGVLQILRLIARMVPTFALLGGERALNIFIPKIESNADKKSFVYFYLALSLLGLLVLLSVFYLFTDAILTHSNDTTLLFPPIFMAIFIILLFGREFLGITLFSNMVYKKSIFVRKIPLLFVTLILCCFYFFFKPSLIDNYALIILLAFSFACAIGAILGIFYAKPLLIPLPKKLHVPSGFKKIILGLVVITILGVIKSDIDRYAVWTFLEIEDLGYYGACITIYLALRYFPQSFGAVFLVTFSKIIKKENQDEIKQLYNKIFFRISLLVVVGTLMVSSFSYHILMVYGETYAQYYCILLLLSVRGIITIPSLLNSPLILSGQHVGFRVFYDSAELIMSSALIFFLGWLYGLTGVAVARVFTGIVMEAMGIYYVKRKRDIFIPYRYVVIITVQLINSYFIYLYPKSIPMSLLIFFSSLMLLFIFRATSIKEVSLLIHSIKARKSL